MRRVACFLFMLAVALPASSQFWEKKPMEEWSAGDSRKVLEDSPWTEKWTTVEQVIQQTGRASDSMDRETTKELWYRLQFWSALPMRQARVRSMQHQMKYNQLGQAEKAQIDANAKQFIEQPFPDTIVIRVLYGSNVQDYARKMTKFWSEQTFDLQKNLMILVADGKRIPISGLQQGQPGANEFYVMFPRVLDGQPVIAGPGSKIGIEFYHPDVAAGSQGTAAVEGVSPTRVPGSVGTGGQSTPTAAQLQPGRNSIRVWVQFKPNKMQYQGQLAY